MSKLRAEITYNHRLHNNSLFTESTTEPINTDDTDQDPVNLDNPVDDLVPAEENYSEESDDDEADEPQLENEFGEYLQGWIEMLDEEKNAEFDENSDENTEDNNMVNVHDITHPAIDTSAKWALETLFKNNINSPF